MTSIISQIQTRSKSSDPFLGIFDATQMAERITEFKRDPLILSCVTKRLLDTGQGYRNMEDETVLEYLTEDDVELAERIREYYTKKFFWRALSDSRTLSDYRRRLINLLENRITNCKDQDCGIYYKLPYFYEEDMSYDEFKKNLKTNDISSLGNKRSNRFLKQLEFLKTTLSAQRKRKIIRYWFKDDNNWLYGLELTSDNPLLGIFDDYLKDHPVVLFDTRLTEDRIDSMHYYKLFQYKFAKEKNA